MWEIRGVLPKRIIIIMRLILILRLNIGAGYQDRTGDLMLGKHTLYQLS